MEKDCIFCRILAGEIPSSKVYEDDGYLVFKDINPAAPVHLLIVPKKHVARLSEAKAEDRDMLGGLLLTVGHVAREQGLDSYRLIINDGSGAGQTVFHLHAHIISGRELGEKLL